MTVTERVAGVLRLQPRAFEDIEADGDANGQALGIVVLSAAWRRASAAGSTAALAAWCARRSAPWSAG